MRLRIKQARPTSLNDAVRHTVELEAFNRAEKSKLESQGILNAATTSSPTQEQKAKQGADELQQLKSTVERLGKEFEKFIRENKYRYRQPRVQSKILMLDGKEEMWVKISSTFKLSKVKKVERS